MYTFFLLTLYLQALFTHRIDQYFSLLELFIFKFNYVFLSTAVEVKLDRENIAGDVWKIVKEIPSFPSFPIPILDPNSVFTVDQTQ